MTYASIIRRSIAFSVTLLQFGCATSENPRGHASASSDYVASDHTVVSGVSIPELLRGRDRFQGRRVEVVGYYRSFFEHSVLTAAQTDAFSDGLWIDMFHISPESENRLEHITRGPARVIGTFRFSEMGFGHCNICPGEIKEVELFKRPQ